MILSVDEHATGVNVTQACVGLSDLESLEVFAELVVDAAVS